MKMMWMVGLLVVVAVALVAAGCAATRGGYESAPYQVVRASGDFQLRDYPPLTVVETPMAADGRAADGSFRRLFGFITGGNAAGQKIAMTTPVFMTGGGTNAVMAFVMPAQVAAGGVPRPADPRVRVRELPAGRFAVLRYSGGRGARTAAAALARLQAWMSTQGWQASSPPIYGYFDPPWTPSFLRRNEVMLQLAGGPPLPPPLPPAQ